MVIQTHESTVSSMQLYDLAKLRKGKEQVHTSIF